MPTTVNGIGTRYCGKQDAAARPGSCRHCHAETTLESYTTRLWFSIFYIPIIPLKRLRIIDECPVCSRHWHLNPEKYEEIRESTVSEAFQNHRTNPTVESALLTHGQCLAYHMQQEADTFLEAAITQFPNNAELLLGFAANLDQMGRDKEATFLYKEVLTLCPESPNARYRVALSCLTEGELDDAYDLLDFLRSPGSSATYNTEILLALAHAYQTRGEHERTLELSSNCLREKPELGEQYAFRKLVTKSEQSLKHTSSILPDRPFSIQGLFGSSDANPPWVRRTLWWSIAGLLVVVGAMGLNEYYRRNRSLYVLSAFAQPLQVSIDGGSPVTIQGRAMIPVSEGQHQVSISGPVTKQITADIRSPYFSRWLSNPLWVVNVEKLSDLYVQSIYYSNNPKPSEATELDEEVHFIPHVDYAFQAPPASIETTESSSVITKVHVDSLPVQPTYIAIKHLSMPDKNIGLTFCEGYLEKNASDEKLLVLYTRLAKGPDHEQRAVNFLNGKLWDSPISIPLHRVYSSIDSIAKNESQLREEYDSHLQQNPHDFALLYLRGRITPDRKERLDFFQKSHQEMPSSGWAPMALGADAAYRGEWKEALTWCEKVTDNVKTSLSFRELLHEVRMATGDTAALVTEYRQDLSGDDPTEVITSLLWLVESQAIQGKYVEARQESATFMQPGDPNIGVEGMSDWDLMLDYVCSDTALFLRKQSRIPPESSSTELMHLLLATGQPDAASKLKDIEQEMDDWENLIAMSVSFSLMGNTTAADHWRSRACAQLKMGDSDSQLAATLFDRDAPPTDEELDAVSNGITSSPIFLTALAQRFPDRKVELLNRAAKLNIRRFPPYLLVKQVIEQK